MKKRMYADVCIIYYDTYNISLSLSTHHLSPIVILSFSESVLVESVPLISVDMQLGFKQRRRSSVKVCNIVSHSVILSCGVTHCVC